jgi:hypothetical protein
MRFHPGVVEQIILNCRNFGGHASEKKLRDILSQKRYAVYAGDRQDMILVDADQYINEAMSRRQSTNSIVPMALHTSAFEKILYFFDLYSGYDSEQKLRTSLSKLEFTPYERKMASNDVILVLTEDYMKVLQGTPKF